MNGFLPKFLIFCRREKFPQILLSVLRTRITVEDGSPRVGDKEQNKADAGKR